jgi:hypothetical protein
VRAQFAAQSLKPIRNDKPAARAEAAAGSLISISASERKERNTSHFDARCCVLPALQCNIGCGDVVIASKRALRAHPLLVPHCS